MCLVRFFSIRSGICLKQLAASFYLWIIFQWFFQETLQRNIFICQTQVYTLRREWQIISNPINDKIDWKRVSVMGHLSSLDFKPFLIPSSFSGAVPAMPLFSRPNSASTDFPSLVASSTILVWASVRAGGTSSLILENSSTKQPKLQCSIQNNMPLSCFKTAHWSNMMHNLAFHLR